MDAESLPIAIVCRQQPLGRLQEVKNHRSSTAREAASQRRPLETMILSWSIFLAGQKPLGAIVYQKAPNDYKPIAEFLREHGSSERFIEKKIPNGLNTNVAQASTNRNKNVKVEFPFCTRTFHRIHLIPCDYVFFPIRRISWIVMTFRIDSGCLSWFVR